MIFHAIEKVVKEVMKKQTLCEVLVAEVAAEGFIINGSVTAIPFGLVQYLENFLGGEQVVSFCWEQENLATKPSSLTEIKVEEARVKSKGFLNIGDRVLILQAKGGAAFFLLGKLSPYGG